MNMSYKTQNIEALGISMSVHPLLSIIRLSIVALLLLIVRLLGI